MKKMPEKIYNIDNYPIVYQDEKYTILANDTDGFYDLGEYMQTPAELVEIGIKVLEDDGGLIGFQGKDNKKIIQLMINKLESIKNNIGN